MGRDDSKVNEAVAVSPENASNDEEESTELVLFQAKKCYVYMIPPRKSAASYRAAEWDINKWNWEGALRVVAKGEECSVRLEDQTTGELYAQALVRQDYPLPVEAVIDSSRFFVLRIEDTSNNKHARHAFVGLGFRERPEAYDFQAALFDHMKYLNKKKEAQEMEQEYQNRPSMDYSLKEGETFRLQLKTPSRISGDPGKFGRVIDVSSLQEALPGAQSKPSFIRVASGGYEVPILVPPPPPPLSPISGSPSPVHQFAGSPVLGSAVGGSDLSDFKLDSMTYEGDVPVGGVDISKSKVEPTVHEDGGVEEDFGDFQAA